MRVEVRCARVIVGGVGSGFRRFVGLSLERENFRDRESVFVFVVSGRVLFFISG